jgi:hypothetical protein
MARPWAEHVLDASSHVSADSLADLAAVRAAQRAEFDERSDRLVTLLASDLRCGADPNYVVEALIVHVNRWANRLGWAPIRGRTR